MFPDFFEDVFSELNWIEERERDFILIIKFRS